MDRHRGFCDPCLDHEVGALDENNINRQFQELSLITDGGGGYVPLEPSLGDTYPTPRSPELNLTRDILFEFSKDIVGRQSPRRERLERYSEGDVTYIGSGSPGYEISSGERILLVVDTNFDKDLVDLFVDGIREMGARVDTVTLDFTRPGIDQVHPWFDEFPGILDYQLQGMDHKETFWTRLEDRGFLFGIHKRIETGSNVWWEDVLTDADIGYDLLIYGQAGPIHRGFLEEAYWNDGPRYERIPIQTKDDLAAGAHTYPKEIADAIDQKAYEMVMEANKVHLTDPEGTDITFTNYDDDGVIKPRNHPCHIWGHPNDLRDQIDTTGVVAGTINHVNAYPRVEVDVEDAVITEIRGGGEYGELWRELHEETEDVQYPHYPNPGLFHLWEVAIGTNPWMVRPATRQIDQYFFPLIERRRSGIIHVGFGTPNGANTEVEAREQGLPWGHVHIHLNFPTYEYETESGERKTLIEKGHLTVLDDPEIREIAARYGDPDELLTEKWIPAVPGINAPGDYNADYAEDPRDWLEEDRLDRMERYSQ